jgi:hypothetical protein
MNAAAQKAPTVGTVAGHSKREWALALAADGFAVFPLAAGSKVPRKGSNGFKDATHDVVTVAEVWSDDACQSNIGIATGFRNTPNGPRPFVVIDLDRKNGNDGVAMLDALAVKHGGEVLRTFTAKTPNGGGRHLFLYTSQPVGSNVGKVETANGVEKVRGLGAGIDVRGVGAYVVAPGSTLANRAYTVEDDTEMADCPAWLEALLPKPGAKADKTQTGKVAKLPGVDPYRARQRGIDYLATAPEAIEGAGGDDCTYGVATKLLALGNMPAAAFDLMASEHWFEGCGWTPEKLIEKIAHAERYMQDPIGTDAPEAQFEAVNLDDTSEDPPTAIRENPFKPLRLSDLRALPWPEWTVRNVIPAKGMGVIFGPSKSGKTFLALDIACACVRGIPWAGLPTRQGVAVYIGLEGQARTRAFAYAKANGLDDAALADLIIFEQPPLNLLTVGKGGSVPLLVDAVRSAIPGRPVALTIVDTLAQATPGGDENSSVMMGAAIGNAKTIAQELGGTVVLIHHSGKNDAAGARGHSSLAAAADFQIEVTRPGDGAMRSARVTKVKDAEDGARWNFQLGVVDLGLAPATDGCEPEARTSCVVADLVRVDTVSSAAKTLPKFSTLQSLVFQAFTTAAGALDGDAIDWDNTGTCSLDAWESAYFESTPLKESLTGKELTKARESRARGFRRSVASLTEGKWVTTVREKGRTRYRLGRAG